MLHRVAVRRRPDASASRPGPRRGSARCRGLALPGGCEHFLPGRLVPGRFRRSAHPASGCVQAASRRGRPSSAENPSERMAAADRPRRGRVGARATVGAAAGAAPLGRGVGPSVVVEPSETVARLHGLSQAQPEPGVVALCRSGGAPGSPAGLFGGYRRRVGRVRRCQRSLSCVSTSWKAGAASRMSTRRPRFPTAGQVTWAGGPMNKSIATSGHGIDSRRRRHSRQGQACRLADPIIWRKRP